MFSPEVCSQLRALDAARAFGHAQVALMRGAHVDEDRTGALAGSGFLGGDGFDGHPEIIRRQHPADERAAERSALQRQDFHDAAFARLGLEAVADRVADAGPLGGLEALAHACGSEWLLTLPVDLVGFNECLLPTLRAGTGTNGARAEDDEGPQPLVALWRTAALRQQAPIALAAGDLSVQALQARLGMPWVRFAGVRFGNLNTVDDLRAAGFEA